MIAKPLEAKEMRVTAAALLGTAVIQIIPIDRVIIPARSAIFFMMPSSLLG